jgi:hypothetical protein
MKRYTVSFDVTREQLTKFLDDLGPAVPSINVATYNDGFETEPSEAPHPPKEAKPRAPRASKVNDALLKELESGSRTSGQLGAALVSAGLSKGSLGGALKFLQETNLIVKTPDGQYASLVPVAKTTAASGGVSVTAGSSSLQRAFPWKDDEMNGPPEAA